MENEEKSIFDMPDEQYEEQFIVKDATKSDHLLILSIGVVPFVIASIIYNLVF